MRNRVVGESNQILIFGAPFTWVEEIQRLMVIV